MTSAPPIPAELWAKVPPEAQAALLVVIAQYDLRVETLEKRVAELEQRLGINSTNSSVPPSANPPGAPKPVVKKPSGRKTGGQLGHDPHLKQRLSPERVTKVIRFIPKKSRCCQAALPAQAGANDPEPSWH